MNEFELTKSELKKAFCAAGIVLPLSAGLRNARSQIVDLRLAGVRWEAIASLLSQALIELGARYDPPSKDTLRGVFGKIVRSPNLKNPIRFNNVEPLPVDDEPKIPKNIADPGLAGRFLEQPNVTFNEGASLAAQLKAMKGIK